MAGDGQSYMRRNGFSLIEIIVTVAVITVIMIPLSLMMIEYARSVASADSIALGANLLQKELATVNNISFASLTSADFTSYSGYNYDLTRTVSDVNTNIKKIALIIYPHPKAANTQLLSCATYALGGNVLFGSGSAGGAAGQESASFQASAGTISNNQLINVSLQNTRSNGNITVTSLKITSSRDKILNTASFEGYNMIDATASLTADTETTVVLDRNIYLRSVTSYTGTNGLRLIFNSTANASYTLKVKFVFYDNSESDTYTWTY